MTGGLMKTTTSRLALAAIASVVATGAYAADLGGNCCVDLEERVAELEATTALKGNRKMSLTVSGQVNKAIIWHNSDDVLARRQGDFTITDNLASQTRFRFTGSAKLDADRTVGFNLELGIAENEGVGLSAGSNSFHRVRQSNVYIASKTLGTVTLGMQNGATESLWDISLANIGTSGSQGDNDFAQQVAGPTGNAFDNAFVSYNAGRAQAISYTTPVFAGFVMAAAYWHGSAPAAESVDDDTTGWDIALRYAGEFNGIRLAAGIGYREFQQQTVSTETDSFVLGSASAMHVPTGLFISGGYGQRDRSGTDVAGDDVKGWHIEAGIERNFFGIGNTTLFGEYSETNYDMTTGTTTVATASAFNDGNYWGLGIVQNLAAGSSDLYLRYRSYEGTGIERGADGTAIGNDISVLSAGMIVKF